MKFDVNNLPDLKIMVVSQEEIDRALNALVGLGFKNWSSGLPFEGWGGIEYVGNWIELTNKQVYCPVPFCLSPKSQQISLAELEALAAEKQGKKTSKEWAESMAFEILDPDGWDRSNFDYSFNQELISKDEFAKRLCRSTCRTKTVSKLKFVDMDKVVNAGHCGDKTSLAMNEETDEGWGEFELGDLERARLEAQERYDAALSQLKSVTGFYNSDYNEIFLEDCSEILMVLKIAAGLPTEK